MAWNQYVEIYAFRDKAGSEVDSVDVGALTVSPGEESPLQFAKKLKALAKAIEKAERRFPGQVFINTNY